MSHGGDGAGDEDLECLQQTQAHAFNNGGLAGLVGSYVGSEGQGFVDDVMHHGWGQTDAVGLGQPPLQPQQQHFQFQQQQQQQLQHLQQLQQLSQSLWPGTAHAETCFLPMGMAQLQLPQSQQAQKKEKKQKEDPNTPSLPSSDVPVHEQLRLVDVGLAASYMY